MSQWFAAHLVMYVKLKEQPQNCIPVWENIILVKASSEAEAFAKAESRGHEEAGDEDGTFRWDGKAARWVFAGVRKLTACEDPDKRPGDGTEVTYTEMALHSEQDVQKLVKGDPVTVEYRDRFADELSDCAP